MIYVYVGIIGFLLFFIICGLVDVFIKKGNVTAKSKESSLMDFSRVIIYSAIFLLLVVTIIPIATKISRSSSEGGSADGFTIEKYEVTLDVDKDNKILVNEDILINFFEEGHHGIYKTVARWLEYTDKTGKTTSRKAVVDDFWASENFSTEMVNGKDKIKIGDPYTTLPIGNHEYNIRYTYDMDGDIYDGFDEFIFHAFGDFWGTRINKASLIIHMPSDVDKEEIHFFADKKRKKDITDKVDIKVVGNTIYAEVSDAYELNKSLTVDIELPDGYFTNTGSEAYGYVSFSICLICIIVALISFIIWFKVGKDYPRGVETVEFYPPYNYDPAEIGFLYKGTTGKRLTVATIVSLAAKDYIKIIEDKENDEITVIKNTNLSLDEAVDRKIKIVKLKDIGSGKDVTKEAKKFMKNFSSRVYETEIVRDFDKTLEEIQPLIDLGYIKIEHDSLDDFKPEALDKVKEDIARKNAKSNELTDTERLVFNSLFEKECEVKLSEHTGLYKVFSDVDNTVTNKLDSLINDIKARKFTIISGLWLFICVVLFGFAYIFIKDLDNRFVFLYYFAYVANIVTLIFTLLMKRKTLYGEEVTAKVSGFKNYLEVAEKDRIEKLVEENPNYFYDILPYAYALDVSSKWVEKFENIPIPEKEFDSFDFHNIDSLDNIYSSVYVPSSSGGGGGGGCSSCGGGCSSCGGGGSW